MKNTLISKLRVCWNILTKSKTNKDERCILPKGRHGQMNVVTDTFDYRKCSLVKCNPEDFGKYNTLTDGGVLYRMIEYPSNKLSR